MPGFPRGIGPVKRAGPGRALRHTHDSVGLTRGQCVGGMSIRGIRRPEWGATAPTSGLLS